MLEAKKIRMEQLAPLIEETLADGGTFEIAIKGTSMLPLLVEGRDTVVLAAVGDTPEKNDILFYRRSNGAYVLHRTLGSRNGEYIMCGDNQWVLERGIEHSQVIGKVCKITRKGKCFETTNSRYKLYCRIWQFLFPVRKYLIKIRGKLRK